MVEDSERWRQRYTEALDRFRGDEVRWNAVESALRKLVARLSGMVVSEDPDVRERIAETRSTMRRDNLDPDQLSALEQRLASALFRLDDTVTVKAGPAAAAAPAPTPVADAATPRLRSLLLDLVRRLPDDLLESREVDALSRTLRETDSTADICDVTVRLADALALRVAELAQERERLQGMLAQVSTQLRGIEAYFSAQLEQYAAARSSGEGLSTSVLAEMRQLNDSVTVARDLGGLQREVKVRLSAIGDHLQEFRSREEQRIKDWEQRTSQQKTRIEELENEMQAVQHRLRVREREVLTDSLTGVANRQAYDERLKDELPRWQRAQKPVCLAALDIDFFKKINDQHGHQTGDRVLQGLARHMQRYLREQDFVARYGGEEFVVVLEGMDLRQSFKALDKLRKSVEGLTFPTAGKALNITVSAGISGLLSTDSAQTLFERADKALYQAKNTGRNRCVAL